jgi:YggT family protein
MFVAANFLQALAAIINWLLTILWWLILVRALLSWVNPDPYNPIVQFLYKTTEPILEPLRRILPIGFRFGLDLSPLIAFAIIYFLRLFLVPTLMQLSFRLSG